MKQSINAQPFINTIVSRASAGLAGRWSNLRDEAPIAKVAARRKAGETSKLWLNVVRALVHIMDGSATISYVSRADPALVSEITTQGSVDGFLYRSRACQIYFTGAMQQSPDALVLFATRLLINRTTDFSNAYLALLVGVAAAKPQPELDALMATAADELMFACQEDLALDEVPSETVWFYAVKKDTDSIDEFSDASALKIGPLLSDAVVFGKYLAGEPTAFDIVSKVPGTAATTASAPIDVSADAFIGPQIDVCIKYAGQGKNVLYYGPTGTGKSFVWEKVMRALDPSFDADAYPYFVHGSGGLEDIDFVGQVIIDKQGDRRWVDGPLTQAMRAGKRFKCEELNRLPQSMLNVLLGAMDFGRIKIHQLDEIVVAQAGFAVDAMANIGREYTATEDIDPAIMRRFQIKVSFDFLPSDQEVKLLRSRHKGLKPEDAETLVRIANEIRRAHEEGSGAVDVDLYVSPAGLLNSAELVAAGVPIMEAIELTWLADVAYTKAHRESTKAKIDMIIRERKGRKGARP